MSTKTVDPEIVALVERAQEGDEQAFAAIYDLYIDQIFGFIFNRVRNRHLAEDLTSDVFLRALRALPGFTWQGVDIGAWLTTIARNRVTDHFKSARARLERPANEIHDEPEFAGEPEDPESALLAQDLTATLGRAIAQLLDDHQEVLLLRFTQGLSVAETAHAMDRTDGAIKALQYRALRALADVVKNDPAFSEEVAP